MPSWSWASVSLPIVFDDTRIDGGKVVPFVPDVTVLNIFCRPTTANRFGAVEGGLLTLQGKLIRLPIIFSRHLSRPSFSYRLVGYSAVFLIHMTFDTGFLAGEEVRFQPAREARYIRRASGEEIGNLHAWLRYSVRCLCLGTIGARWVVVLLLGRSPSRPESYERIGLAHLENLSSISVFSSTLQIVTRAWGLTWTQKLRLNKWRHIWG